ncbi:hypothetical protein GCM10017559_33580 [Streptosporangium longisporum]|uniref:Uncharacterized protein n=2 Tax=Streptosporangium longisporum TaxID=46187 RepID=A0ABP6KKQ4_9ACTN
MAGAHFTIWPGLVPTSELISIYRRRARHTRRKNIPTLGFDEAILNLEACGLEHLNLGIVPSTPSAYHFQLFLSPDSSRVVACLGVGRNP